MPRNVSPTDFPMSSVAILKVFIQKKDATVKPPAASFF
jgi:hypothetical protein